MRAWGQTVVLLVALMVGVVFAAINWGWLQQQWGMQGSGGDEEVFSSEEEDAECLQLREKIGIRQAQLHALVNDREKFLGTIVELVNQAIGKIYINEKQELRLALVFLKQSEKVLEYAASSGKNISKELIISILHNQAAIYQKLWELNNCTNYLEGIIYNYDAFIRESSNPASVLLPHTSAAPIASIPDCSRARMRQKLARYNLQFCAVNSQLAEHDAALAAVRKAQALMADCIGGSAQELSRQFQKDLRCDAPALNARMSLLLGLLAFDRRLEASSDPELPKNILKSTHFSLQILQESKRARREAEVEAEEREYSDFLAGYSIGNIVEIVPMGCDSSEIGLVSLLKEKASREGEFHPLSRVILLSACFFSRATELRLKAVELFRRNLEERKYCREYRLSVSYHLLAVIVAALFVPCDLKYLTQILTSYEKHYNTSLLDYKTVETESLNKIAELLGIEVTDHCKEVVQVGEVEVAEVVVEQGVGVVGIEGGEVECRNDYNMKVGFENDRLKRLEKMKSLKKITKELTEPPKKYDEKDLRALNKSKENKTSFSNSKPNPKERTLSRNDTLKKSPTFKDTRDHRDKEKERDREQKEREQRERVEKQQGGVRGTPKQLKGKRSPNEMGKSRNREEKKSRTRQVVDETEELFFCFTKKTKKTQGVGLASSQLRSTSIGSISGKSKSKKSILSPRAMQVKLSNGLKSPKSPPKRRNIGETYYF